MSIASWTWNSDSASNALVDSSSITIGGFFRINRAIATRCFCPPESCVPLVPTTVSRPSGKSAANSNTYANLAASSTASFDASGEPYLIFSSMVVEKSRGSWATIPTLRRTS
mmetsp:Transcript_38638/g.93619  ORF Transcript_38638/g.93619 Transcript_38638/m.93619 type:complete len:112 (+) Transcript_38638:527-862(+)